MGTTEKTELTVMCMICDGTKILVQDRVNKDWPGVTFPGGHVEPGEAFTDAVRREVKEETGLDIFRPTVCGINDFVRDDGTRYIVLFFRADRFSGVGPFLRPAGTLDHHTLFMIQTPPFMKGCEHFTFHMGSGTEVLLAGTRFEQKGWTSFWGPGRHLFGSNWFWYFNSPLGCHIEYDADMDQHDDHWQPREALPGADNSQYFLLGYREKWAPGPDNAR